MVEFKFWIIVILFCLGAAAITFILGKFIKSKRFTKYIPAIVFLLSGIASYIKSRYFSESFQDIAYLLLAIIAAFMFAASLLTAVIMDNMNRNNHK